MENEVIIKFDKENTVTLDLEYSEIKSRKKQESQKISFPSGAHWIEEEDTYSAGAVLPLSIDKTIKPIPTTTTQPSTTTTQPSTTNTQTTLIKNQEKVTIITTTQTTTTEKLQKIEEIKWQETAPLSTSNKDPYFKQLKTVKIRQQIRFRDEATLPPPVEIN